MTPALQKPRRWMPTSRRALHETEGLLRAARAIMSATDFLSVCQQLTAHFKDLVQARTVFIYLVNHTRRQIILSTYDGAPIEDDTQMTYDILQAGITGRVHQTREPVLSLHAYDGIEPEATRERRLRGGTGPLIVVPLIARDDVIGTVTAINGIGQRLFTPHDVSLLMSLATQAATTIDNLRLLTETERQVQRWESISKVNASISAQLDVEKLFDILYQEALRLMNVAPEKATFFIAFYDAEENRFAFDLHYDCGRRLPSTTFPFGPGISSWVVEHNAPLLLQDAVAQQAEYGYKLWPTQFEIESGQYAHACVAAPLRLGDRVTGVISVQSLDAGVFAEDHLTLLSMWSSQIAIALHNARLVEQLRQRTTELQARNEELDAFAHTVAHDLKNPLSLIIGHADLLKLSLEDPPADILHSLNTIFQTGSKMGRIIEELMLLAGIHKQQPLLLPLDMAEIIQEAQARIADVIARRGAAIHLPETWPLAVGYAPWIEEVWMNYLSNALKYGGEPPHITLGAAIVDFGLPISEPVLQSITSKIQNPAAKIVFWVRDNGPGLTPEQQAQLFVPFERLEQIHIRGHGLGLSIVRRIVEKLGGEVGVESAPGAGCCFYFTLPIVDF